MKLIELTVDELEEFRDRVNALQLLNTSVAVISINKRLIPEKGDGIHETFVEEKMVYDIFYWEIPTQMGIMGG